MAFCWIFSAIRRFDGFPRSPWITALSPCFFNAYSNRLPLPYPQPQLLGDFPLLDQFLLGLPQCHQPVPNQRCLPSIVKAWLSVVTA